MSSSQYELTPTDALKTLFDGKLPDVFFNA